MQHEFIENWKKMSQSLSKPLIQLAELNINSFNNLAIKNANLMEDAGELKKPEDWMSMQIKVMNSIYLEASKYAQKAIEIGLETASETSKIWSDTVNQTANKAADYAKSGVNMANKSGKEQHSR